MAKLLAGSTIGGNKIADTTDVQKVQDAVNTHTQSFDHVPYVEAGGAVNAYTATFPGRFPAYVEGMAVSFRVLHNTGPSTLDVNGLGPKAIVRPDLTDLKAGDFKFGGVYTARYDGTQFVLQGMPVDGGSTGGGSAPDYTPTDLVEMYVNGTTGTDAPTSGKTAAAPFKTIKYALNSLPKVSSKSYRLNITSGTYNEDIKVEGFNNQLYLEGRGGSVIIPNTLTVNRCWNVALTAFNTTGYIIRNTNYAALSSCVKNSTTGTFGIIAEYSSVVLSICSFSNTNAAISSRVGSIVSMSNISGATNGTGINVEQGLVFVGTPFTMTSSIAEAVKAGAIYK